MIPDDQRALHTLAYESDHSIANCCLSSKILRGTSVANIIKLLWRKTKDFEPKVIPKICGMFCCLDVYQQPCRCCVIELDWHIWCAWRGLPAQDGVALLSDSCDFWREYASFNFSFVSPHPRQAAGCCCTESALFVHVLWLLRPTAASSAVEGRHGRSGDQQRMETGSQD